LWRNDKCAPISFFLSFWTATLLTTDISVSNRPVTRRRMAAWRFAAAAASPDRRTNAHQTTKMGNASDAKNIQRQYEKEKCRRRAKMSLETNVSKLHQGDKTRDENGKRFQFQPQH